MSIHKECVDALRAKYRALTRNKLIAGHAHEIVAAYFGYGTAAALRAEAKYPLTSLEEAEILMPALAVMDQRIAELQGFLATCQQSTNLQHKSRSFLSKPDISRARSGATETSVRKSARTPMKIR